MNSSVSAEDNRQSVLPVIANHYLANPGMGWQEAHTLDNPLLPETTPYRRPTYGWNTLNPAEGIFDFTAIESDLAEVMAEGGQLSFRVYTMRGEGWGGHKIPTWVLAEDNILLANGEPDYSSCVYQQRWGEFVEALRWQYDGNPHIAFIDISGYGNFNEWSWQAQTEWDDDFMNPASLDGQARNRLADMFIGGTGTIQCRGGNGELQTVTYAYDGFQTTQLLMPYAGIQQSTRYVAAKRTDVGIRHDSLGSAQHTNNMLDKIGDVIENTWQNAPIVYELAHIAGDHPNLPQHIAAADAVLRHTHGTAVHDNVPGERDSSMFTELMRDVGYRYTLVSASFAETVAVGEAMPVQMDWQNVGIAPAYAKMGQAFELRLYLVDELGNVVAERVVAENVNGWMPAFSVNESSPSNVVDVDVWFGVNAGIYTLTTAIIDTRTNTPIALAIAGQTDSGHYELGQIEVIPSFEPTYTTFLPLVR